MTEPTTAATHANGKPKASVFFDARSRLRLAVKRLESPMIDASRVLHSVALQGDGAHKTRPEFRRARFRRMNRKLSQSSHAGDA